MASTTTPPSPTAPPLAAELPTLPEAPAVPETTNGEAVSSSPTSVVSQDFSISGPTIYEVTTASPTIHQVSTFPKVVSPQHETIRELSSQELAESTQTSTDAPATAKVKGEKKKFGKDSVRAAMEYYQGVNERIGFYWPLPAVMIFLALAGLFGSLGHHLYNTSLNGRVVVGAEWPQRFGLALAFFIKMVLVGSVQLAFKQRAWVTVKKRGFRLETLDSIFQACYDPVLFFNLEFLLGAFIPAILAILCWILPLSAIAAPSALTTKDAVHISNQICHNVSTVNFFWENGFNIFQRSLTVDKQGMSYWDNFENGTSWYNSPSMDHKRMFTLSILSETPVTPINPCPSESNCTYSISFAAPSYKCEMRDDFGGQRTYNLSVMAPKGNMLYGSYSSFDEDFVGRPLDWDRNNPTNDTGIWRKEPSLWVGWVENTTLPATPENATQWNTTHWWHQLTPRVMECILYNSTYNYTLSFLGGQMIVNQSSVVPREPLLPEGKFMAPNMPTYMEHSGFHAMGWLYRTKLMGNNTQDGTLSWVTTESDVMQTTLMDPGNGLPRSPDFRRSVEEGFQNILLSFIGDWKQKAQIYIDADCEVSSHVIVWRYQPRWLAVSYIVAVSVTLVACGVGLHAIYHNGYVAQTNFSTFLTTTRNPDLDAVSKGECLGALPIRKELLKTRLRFGETGGAGEPHSAFGFADEVAPMVKGKKYE